jgi:catechol 2,3-dioxygenase-like lactoylglutathione lyase family enzyme
MVLKCLAVAERRQKQTCRAMILIPLPQKLSIWFNAQPAAILLPLKVQPLAAKKAAPILDRDDAMTKNTSDVNQMHHVALATEDLKSTIEFYSDVVGLEAGPTPSSSGLLQWMYAGDNPVLHIFQPKVERHAPVAGVYGVAHLALHIRDLENAITRLEQHEIAYETNVMDSRNAHQVFFDGPDGVRIELIEIGRVNV